MKKQGLRKSLKMMAWNKKSKRKKKEEGINHDRT